MKKLSERERFETAFAGCLGKTPAEFVRQKLQAGSAVEDIRYLYEIMAVEIAQQNSCIVQGFDLYYPPKEDSTMQNIHKKTYFKLVRDRIPEIIEQSGKSCVWETLSDEAYLRYLEEKLNEELAEYQQSKSLEELADLLEVMGAVVAARGWTWEELTALRKEKRRQRGGFAKKILLKEVSG